MICGRKCSKTLIDHDAVSINFPVAVIEGKSSSPRGVTGINIVAQRSTSYDLNSANVPTWGGIFKAFDRLTLGHNAHADTRQISIATPTHTRQNAAHETMTRRTAQCCQPENYWTKQRSAAD